MAQTFKITLKGHLFEQAVQTLFYYRNLTESSMSAGNLLEAFESRFVSVLPFAMSQYARYEQAVGEELGNDTNFTTMTLNTSDWTGKAGGESYIDYVCVPFKCGSRRKGIKAGSRRLPGVTTNMATASGGWVGSFKTTYLDPCALAFSDSLSVALEPSGAEDVYPVILRHKKVFSGSKMYYAPVPPILSDDYYIADQWQVAPRYGHQISRQTLGT